MAILQRPLAIFVIMMTAAVLLMSASFLTTGAGSADATAPSTLLGTVAVDPDQDPGVADESPVWAILEANGRYYIAGNFTEVGGVTQPYLASIEVATGQLDPEFRPVIAGGNTEIYTMALSPDRQDLYIGGIFTSVDGTSISRIAKLDAITGELDTAFNANSSALVEAIAVDNTGVYVGGKFAEIGGVTSPNLIKLDADTGAADPAWTASVNGTVLDIEVVGGAVYVGGNFTEVNGQANDYLVRLVRNTGATAANWSSAEVPPDKVEVLSIATDASALYVGTSGTLSNGGNGNSVWAYSTTGIRQWQRALGGDVQALEATADTLYVGTHGQFSFDELRYELDGVTLNPNFANDGYDEDSSNANATGRNKLMSLDLDTGAVTSWNPDLDSVNGVWELETGPSGLLVGGDFTTIANPTGVPGASSALFTPHVAVFPGIGSLNAAPEPLFSFDCSGTSCAFDASDSLDDGSIMSYAWDFGNGTSASGLTATKTLANNTTHTVLLTVTDDAGNTASRQQQVIVGDGGLLVTPVGTVSLNQSNNLFQVQIPSNAQAGDVAIAFATMSNSSVSATPPAGWTQVGDALDNNIRTTIWHYTLGANDAGSTVAFSLSSSIKADLTLSVFGGVDGANPIAAVEYLAEPERRVGHRAPALSFAGEATVLHYWADRTTDTSEFFAPPTEATLSTSIGTAGGHISSVLSTIVPAPAGSSAEVVAVAEHHSPNALGWSIALNTGTAVQDTTDPVGAVTSPADGTNIPTGLTNISGTATDDISGVDIVRVQIRRFGPTEFWDGTTWTDTASWHFATLANNGTNTTWTLEDVNLDQADDYQIRLIVRDNAGNIAAGSENPFTSFTVGTADTTDPEGAVTSPADGTNTTTGLTNISGTATDDISGVDIVRVQIRRFGPTEFWDGTTWTDTASWHFATLANNGTNTTWTLEDVNLDQADDYQIRLIVRDNAGNIAAGSENPFTSFTVGTADTTDPEGAVTSPADGTNTTTGLTNISGTATDDISGVDIVRVQIRRFGPTEFWDGTTWTDTASWHFATLANNGTNTTWTLEDVNLDQADDYQIRLIVRDNAGNIAAGSENPFTSITAG